MELIANELTLKRSMTTNVPVKFLLEVSNSMVSGDESAKKDTQLSLIEESYIHNETKKKQLRS